MSNQLLSQDKIDKIVNKLSEDKEVISEIMDDKQEELRKVARTNPKDLPEFIRQQGHSERLLRMMEEESISFEGIYEEISIGEEISKKEAEELFLNNKSEIISLIVLKVLRIDS